MKIMRFIAIVFVFIRSTTDRYRVPHTVTVYDNFYSRITAGAWLPSTVPTTFPTRDDIYKYCFIIIIMRTKFSFARIS